VTTTETIENFCSLVQFKKTFRWTVLYFRL